MKVEIISSTNIVEAQEQINKFLVDNQINIILLKTDPHALHDLYYDGNICNQWIEYITTIIYENKKI
jgi:hypothetical protein